MVIWQGADSGIQHTDEVFISDLKRTVVDKNFDFLNIERALVPDEDGDRPIHIAVVHEDVKLVHWLCNLMKVVGASLDMTNDLRQTPLHLAILVENTNIMETLLKEGATVQPRDRHGNTVLHLAVQYFNEECLATLLRHAQCKTILNTRNYEGYSALHIAAFNQNLSAIRMLAKFGCDINIQDGKSGRTPLMHSVLSRYEKVVFLLRKLGACSHKSDYAGISPLHVAIESNNAVMIVLLENDLTRFNVNCNQRPCR